MLHLYIEGRWFTFKVSFDLENGQKSCKISRVEYNNFISTFKTNKQKFIWMLNDHLLKTKTVIFLDIILFDAMDQLMRITKSRKITRNTL